MKQKKSNLRSFFFNFHFLIFCLDDLEERKSNGFFFGQLKKANLGKKIQQKR